MDFDTQIGLSSHDSRLAKAPRYREWTSSIRNRGGYNAEMHITLELALFIEAIVGLVIATVAICGLIPSAWGLVGWTVSLISLVRTLAIRRRVTSHNQPAPLIWRMVLASIAVFCLVFLVAMATAGGVNPQAIGQVEWYLGLALIVVGTVSFSTVLRLGWK